jgi:hypothetical protein
MRDVAEDDQADAVVDELLHDLTGDASPELEEGRFETGDSDNEGPGASGEGLAEEVEGVDESGTGRGRVRGIYSRPVEVTFQRILGTC